MGAVPFVESFAVIPVSVLAGLHIVPVTLLAFLGNLLTMLFVILFIDKIKAWRQKGKWNKIETIEMNADQNEELESAHESMPGTAPESMRSKRSQRAQRIWAKYGLPGLAMVGPFFVGSHLAAFMCMIFGSTKRAAILWMTISLVVWCGATAVISHFGFNALF